MSVQEVLVLSTKNNERPSADFQPSIWGDYFLTHSVETVSVEKMRQQVEELKEEVRGSLMDSHKKPLQKLELIDAVQRLGVSYHFEREINEILENMHHNYSNTGFLNSEHDDLCTIALWFRLLRQHGYYTSCDVFNKFKDGEGNFMASLTIDVVSMLSLYEAAQLRIQGEQILDEAMAFTTTHLESMVSSISPYLSEKVTFALNRPIRKNSPRLETRHYISLYPKEDFHNPTLLKLAELDFNVLQALHQQEVSNMTRWWKNLDFQRKLPYARDRVVELYFWILGEYFEPQYSLARELATKVITMISILDDTYDAHGTYEELKLFTEEIKRWDVSAIHVLPDYMKLLYKAILDICSDIEEHTTKEGRSYCVHYAKKAMEELVQAYFIEASWFHDAYTPTFEEYMSVAAVTATYYLIITSSFIGMGEIATKEVFDWVCNKPKIMEASSVIGRLMNDMVSHKFEQKRPHIASAIECYMKQHGVDEEKANKMLAEEVDNAWKDINEELLKKPSSSGSTVAFPLLERVLNLTRVTDVVYTDDDCYTNPHKLKHQVELLLKHPIAIREDVFL
ncbi:terpene synthase 1-like [Ziziphus jujuba]|uniref:Terpene synthase 1-like n=1 Tax=Ziziphus jujuba TaxID=326968 RepID=A0ABM4A576_ZIZJJ|nr:terpene synthase 1-like [Ziziphus jujuba]